MAVQYSQLCAENAVKPQPANQPGKSYAPSVSERVKPHQLLLRGRFHEEV